MITNANAERIVILVWTTPRGDKKATNGVILRNTKEIKTPKIVSNTIAPKNPIEKNPLESFLAGLKTGLKIHFLLPKHPVLLLLQNEMRHYYWHLDFFFDPRLEIV